MPLQATSGAASYDGFGGGAAAVIPYYIEDMFSCFLYTGNATARSIVNNIDISGNGGLVWTKSRSLTGSDHFFVDTDRGATKFLNSNSPAAQVSTSDITAFNSTGYALNADINGGFNNNGATFASWTFRKQPKFFDIVTWTGDGTNRAIPHNLGSVPGCMIVKCTNAAYGWMVYHRSTGATKFLYLDTTDAAITNSTAWNDTAPTSTVFTVGNAPLGNESGKTYVAYLFAHNAGGFGLTGTDNVISCGTCSSDGSGYIQPVNLGYEPQWVMLKRTNSTGNWVMMDTMRGMANTAVFASPILLANTSAAEAATGVQINPTATGFEDTLWGGWGASNTYIYIAIRRGPMKTPTVGTSVYNAIARTGTGANAVITGVGFVPDLAISKSLTTVDVGAAFDDRLRGATRDLRPNGPTNEATVTTGLTSFNMDGISVGAMTASPQTWNWSGEPYINYFFQRRPSFFDEVCYTGTGSATTQAHNLGVAPELMIVKRRTGAATLGSVYSATIGNTKKLELFSDTGDSAAFVDTTQWNSTTPTSSVFTLGTNGGVNGSGSTYVAWLFATCAGVSKVGSYTGTGTTQTINCGFTAGSRFVMIKRTDSTGDWYVWDSTRGIVAGNDPYFRMNLNSLEVTNTDYIDTASTGFEISSTAPAAINASGGTFIFLAIA